jgi:adenylyl- and sulfurtransferase ThiI
LKSQIVTSSWGGRRKLPWAFTEQGVAMLSGVLHSPVAIKVNIAIMREFVKLRNIAGLRAYATEKIEALEKRVDAHDIHLERAFDAIEKMVALPDAPKKKIGFGRDDEAKAIKAKR